METKKLLEYLAIIIDLEKNKYSQEQTIKKINHSILSYQEEYNSNIRLNERSGNNMQDANSFQNVRVSHSGRGIMFFMIYYLGFLGAGLGVMVFFLTHILPLAIVVGIIGAVVGGSIPVFVWKNIMKKRREYAVVQMQRGARAEYELQQNRIVRNNEIAVIVPRLETEKKTMQETYQLTRQTLEKCYSVNIIPKKYRSIAPVCMFYDYILNRRTYSLEKNPAALDEGAINMYEEDLKNARLEHKIDIIIENLEGLRNEQRVLCNIIEEGNRKTHQLLNGINNNVTKVNANLQTIQYQNERRDACLGYIARMKYYGY